LGKVRLPPETVRLIKELAVKHFGPSVRVYLFGSRTDPNKRGGDIDLLFELPSLPEDWFRRKIKFLVDLEDHIGEQKVDLLVKSEGSDDPWYRIAKETGIEL